MDLLESPQIADPCVQFVAARYDAAGEREQLDDYEVCDYDAASWLVPASSESGTLL